MADNSIAGVGKLGLQAKKGMAKRIHIRDADLQIHVPSIQEGSDLEDTHAFKNVLSKYLDEVNTLQHEADAQIQRLVAGETEDLHEVTMAMDEAEASFELMMEIRNKLVEAYKELMRMQ